ncbi:MAG: hypothetical protein COA79_18180 [Planctomycetota bacterium]|nr:MAG: hypothetical protein COA79_18180 [Planctomycetota bacterium]
MKRIMTILILLCLSITFIGKEKNPIESSITKVIVYPDWAFITRRITVEPFKGQKEFTITNLPNWIDSTSLKVQINQNSKIKVLGVRSEKIILNNINEDNLKTIKVEIEKITKSNIELRDLILTNTERINFLQKSKTYKLSLTKDHKIKLTGDEIAQFIETISKSLNQLRKMNRTHNEEIASNFEKSRLLNIKRNKLRAKNNIKKRNIIVSLEFTGNQNESVDISYLVRGAGWYASYDLYTDHNSSNFSIDYNIVVYQTTDEDWQNVELVFSTHNPTQITETPTLKPWVLSRKNLRNKNKRQSYISSNGRLEAIDQSYLDFNQKNPNYMVNFLGNRDNDASNLLLEYIEERGTTVEFPIRGLYSVKTDGIAVPLKFKSSKFSPKLRYFAVPSISKSSYIVGEFKNIFKSPLLPGIVKLYRDGSLGGKSKINFVSNGEEFDLYLGLEEGIKVIRQLDREKSLFISGKSKEQMKAHYIITIKNYLGRKCNIEIQDQFPISQNKDIKLKLLKIAPDPIKKEMGILTWNILLEKDQTKKITFGFEQEYPRNLQINDTYQLKRQLERIRLQRKK